MARTNRRDCRVGQRKKREKSARADQTVKALKREKRGLAPGKVKLVKPATEPDVEPISAKSSDFLAKMRSEVATNLAEVKTAAMHSAGESS